MPTLLQGYQEICTEDLIPLARRKDVLTAVRYLAAAHDSLPERLALTPEMEATYRDVLRHYLTAQGKGHSTIRNSIQGIGQFLKAFHRVAKTARVPVVRPTTMTYTHARRVMNEDSPYKHAGWLNASRYVKPLDQWPPDLLAPFEKYRRVKKDDIRPTTLKIVIFALASHTGYLSLTANERLDYLPPEARKKLMLKRYKDDLETITAPPVLTGWSDLFVLSHVQSFVTWHAWRIHTDADALVHERAPSKPSTLGEKVVSVLLRVAITLKQKEAKQLLVYARSLPKPRKIHNKAAACHRFSFAELEQVALALIDEARRIRSPNSWGSKRPVRYPGSHAASRFQIGLILMLGWRIPMRIRNWCEALLDTNLRHVNGVWLFHFEGAELKIGTRQGHPNVYEMAVPPEVVPYLEEYLHVWRPKLPHAEVDRHVLLTGNKGGGGMFEAKILGQKLKFHVYRYTGKRFFPHLLRTIFTSNMLSAGMDINSVAYGVNDSTATVLNSYNEFQGEVHQRNLQEAYRRALDSNGTANGKGMRR